MSRLTTTATPRRDRAERGVTMVELLVTIVIAAIAFAALVPVFVYASKTSAADNARTVALGIAQDKIERIRSLPYDKVEAATLYTDTADGLGHVASATTGGGGKEFLVDYTVDYQYDPSSPYETPGLELYKRVTVDVYWVGSPKPIKHVVLTTMIYRQYAAPFIVDLQVKPRSTEAPTQGMIVPGVDHCVYITATVMTGTPTKEVRFTLTSANGAYSATFAQPVGTNGVYEMPPWNVLDEGAPDGFYTIKATAVSPGGYMGNTWRVVEQLEQKGVPAPTNLTATPGNNSVTLHWDRPPAGDIAFYEILRSETADPADAQLLDTGPDPLEAVDYPDTTAVNTTHYYYWVRAHDLTGFVSVLSNSADAQPSLHAADDGNPPTIPVLTATVHPTSIALSWTPSVDAAPPDPPSGLFYYEIFRSTDGVTFTYLKRADALSVSDSDPVGSDSPQYWYEIRAVDASANANRSGFSPPVGPIQTPVTKATLTVINARSGNNKSCTVTVQDVVSGAYYDQQGMSWPSPQPVTIQSKRGSAQWHNLPADKNYRVTATYGSSSPGPQTAPPWTITFN